MSQDDLAGAPRTESGEVYRVDGQALERLDRLEEYPRLFVRSLIPSPYGRDWIYVYRGPTRGRRTIRSGDWRKVTGDLDSFYAAAVRTARDPKNPRWRERFA